MHHKFVVADNERLDRLDAFGNRRDEGQVDKAAFDLNTRLLKLGSDPAWAAEDDGTAERPGCGVVAMAAIEPSGDTARGPALMDQLQNAVNDLNGQMFVDVAFK